MMKLTLKVLGTAALLGLALSGCVSSGKYKTATKDLEERNSQLQAAKTENERLAQERAALGDKLTTTEEALMKSAKDRGQLRASLDEMKKAMAELRERQAEQRKRLQEFEDLTRRFKRLTDAGTLAVQIVDGKMVVSLGSDVLFPSGSAKLSSAGLEAVKEVSKQLASIPGKRYQIEGHTDNIPIATAVFPSNWELASARALTVVKTMVETGMPADRVSAASYSEYLPVKPNDTAENRAANRRIAIVVVPDLSSLPGYDELQKLAK
ncbi:MAG: OmpA family protein [Bdellovibrionaceae bacterium]|nr:OmpA family protein [Pseudobdellovibrionaceae bacterium]MBX3033947.1 OmpA family protein [Pseudobdellovibrionaceae bacterium]